MRTLKLAHYAGQVLNVAFYGFIALSVGIALFASVQEPDAGTWCRDAMGTYGC